MRFSTKEIWNIARAWAAITLAFAIMNTGVENLLTSTFLVALGISAITVGAGFIAHELSHKYFAQKYGAISEFRAFDKYLLLAIFMSFFGFIFAMPGAVFIQGKIDKIRYGRISAAGPLANIAMALFFLLISFVPLNILHIIGLSGLSINSWLAAFNVLPIDGFDGAKIFAWSKLNYALLAIGAFSMLVISSIL